MYVICVCVHACMCMDAGMCVCVVLDCLIQGLSPWVCQTYIDSLYFICPHTPSVTTSSRAHLRRTATSLCWVWEHAVASTTVRWHNCWCYTYTPTVIPRILHEANYVYAIESHLITRHHQWETIHRYTMLDIWEALCVSFTRENALHISQSTSFRKVEEWRCPLDQGSIVPRTLLLASVSQPPTHGPNQGASWRIWGGTEDTFLGH